MKLPTLILGTLCLCACTKEMVSVPVVVERTIPLAPPECASQHPQKLNPLPKAKAGDRIEDFAANVGKIHRQNNRQYGALHSDHSVCGVHVRALTNPHGA